ncbi:carboxypeptidase regulatory-like domain-containing protein [Candidatus Micrarchaeota archaeon]|nr:carboxypeptidase regulatory-like domain-containing protein [Candidatus Micrarchaeota archaeon]
MSWFWRKTDSFFQHLDEAKVFRFQVIVFIFLVLAAGAFVLFWSNPRVEFLVVGPDNEPLSGAAVSVLDSSSHRVAQGVTQDGVVVFTDLQMQAYRFEVSANGFNAFSDEFTAKRQHRLKIQLAPQYG